MRPIRRALSLAVAALLTGTAVHSLTATAASSGLFGAGDARFVVTPAPSSLSPDNAGEPSVGVSWPTGSGFYMSGTNVYKLGFAANGTTTYTDASPNFGITPNLDPILSTDPVSGTTIAGGDTGACSAMYRSADDGASWDATLPCSITTDHPTVGWAPSATTPGSRIWYYCQQQSLQACATSTDDGQTWLPGVPVWTLDCEHYHGHIRGSADGTTYLPSHTCFDANGDIRVGGLRTTDDGASWSPYTIPTAVEPAAGFDPAVATTPDNTLYEAWNQADDYHPVIAVSKDHGTTWGSTIDLAGTTSPAIVASTFPTLVAGDNGRVAYSFLGTAEGTPGANPFTKGFHGVWYLYTSFTYDGGKTWKTVRATDTPVQRGEIDSGGTTTTGQRNLLDFMDSSLTKDGRVVVGFADGCLADCETAATQTAGETASTHAWATVAYQTEGLGLFAAYDGSGTTPPPPVDPRTACPNGRAGFLDKPGDATEVVVTGETPLPSDPALDILDGTVEWDAATSSALLTARVADLKTPPTGTGDGYYRWSVKVGADTTTYSITASVPASGAAPSFTLFNTADTNVTTQTLTGSVDRDKGTITIRLSSARYQAAKSANLPLTGGTVFTISGMLGQRSTGVATLTTDTADTTCNGTLAAPAPVVTAPAAPVLSATAHGGTVSLSWNAPANGGAAITGYQVLRGTAAGALTPLTGTTTTSWDDSTGTPGQTYYYAVTATNSAGTSAPSNTVSAVPTAAPGAPTLSAAAGVDSASLTWSPPSDGGSPITSYVVERGTSSGSRTDLATLPAGTTTYTDSQAAAGTTYYYAVRAVNSVGTGPASAEVSATPYTTAGAPTLQATAGKGQVALSWTVPVDGGQAIQGYRIFRGTSSGAEVLVQSIASGTSYVDNTVTGGTTYWYRVAAFTAAGDGAQSNEVSATPKKANK
jgi:fibronectin type 3 domain-containing protein